MLITQYFQQIETQIADYVHILEANLLKDKRSLHIGIIEGELIFTDESALHFIEWPIDLADPIIYNEPHEQYRG